MSLIDNPFITDVKWRIRQMHELQETRCLDRIERLELERLEALFKKLTTERQLTDEELPAVRRYVTKD